MDTNLIKTIAPVVVIVIVLALRFRSMSKERPLNPGTLWVLPVILVGLATFMLVTSPLSAVGLSIGAVALVVGGLIGWQRGKLVAHDSAATV